MDIIQISICHYEIRKHFALDFFMLDIPVHIGRRGKSPFDLKSELSTQLNEKN